jgi:hypothetical protein
MSIKNCQSHNVSAVGFWCFFLNDENISYSLHLQDSELSAADFLPIATVLPTDNCYHVYKQ